MRFAVIDSDGIILRVGTCADSDLAMQAEEGQQVREITINISDNTHKFVKGEFVEIEQVSKSVVAEVRRYRNVLLKSSDWTQMPDSPLGDTKKSKWAIYRQQLRDLPDNITAATLEDVNFPSAPEE